MSFPGMLGSFQIVNMGSLCQFFIGFGKYQIALDRGMQTGNQISLMCPVAGTDDGASRVSADSIGHGPFTADVFSKSASFSVGICIICTSENKRKIISLIVRAGEQKIYCIYEKIIL